LFDDLDGSPPASGLTSIATGTQADALFGAPTGDSHAPDLVGISQHGVVYTGGVSKIAEHGGAAADDRDVPLVVSGAAVEPGQINQGPVLTTQIAPPSCACSAWIRMRCKQCASSTPQRFPFDDSRAQLTAFRASTSPEP
jgi:hypothetical protein